MMRSTLAVVLSCSLVLFGVAHGANEGDEAKAKALFDEARKLAKAEKWAEACKLLAESKKLSPRMLTTYRLADCYEHIGKTESAHAGFLEAADLAKATGDSEKQQDALARAKDVEAKLSRVQLELPKSEALTIKIDDTPIAAALLHEKIPLDPGEHALDVSAPGKQPRTVKFTLPPGPAVTKVTVEPLLSAAVEKTEAKGDGEPPKIDEAKTSSSLKTAGLVTIGVGVIGLGIGSYLGLSAKSLDRDAEALCDATGCTPEGKTLNNDARSRGNVATVVFTVGAVAVATGVVLVLIAPSKSSHATAKVTPWVAQTGGGLGLSGSF